MPDAGAVAGAGARARAGAVVLPTLFPTSSTGVWQPDSFFLFRNFFSATCVWKLPVCSWPSGSRTCLKFDVCSLMSWRPGGVCVWWWLAGEGRSYATLELLFAGQNWTKARRCLHLLLKIYMQSAAGVRKMFVAIFVSSYPASGKGIFVFLPRRPLSSPFSAQQLGIYSRNIFVSVPLFVSTFRAGWS